MLPLCCVAKDSAAVHKSRLPKNEGVSSHGGMHSPSTDSDSQPFTLQHPQTDAGASWKITCQKERSLFPPHNTDNHWVLSMTFLVGDKIRIASSEPSPLYKSHSKEENLPWGEERGHMVLCGTAFQIMVCFEVIFGVSTTFSNSVC